MKQLTVLLFLGVLLSSIPGRADEPIHERAITAEDRAHWAFVPPGRPTIPPVRETSWVREP